MKELQFYRCDICGIISALVVDGKGTMSCCGKPMTLLKANSTEAATEKHIPEVSVNGDELVAQVGSVIHPMSDEHHISFIAVEFSDGSYTIKELAHTESPVANFNIKGKTPVKVYEFCNLHGLWVKEI